MSFLESLMKMDGKVVVVTGANGQLGRSLSAMFKGAGCRVVGMDVSKSLEADANLDAFIGVDISKKSQVKAAFEDVYSSFGHVDVLINNAGISTFEPFEERTEESFDAVMDVNLKGTFFCIQEYVRGFDTAKSKKGSIVNIASFYGMVSPDFRVYTDCARMSPEVYGATKAGIIQMTKYFSVYLAKRHIRVNAVSPGGIFNDNNPQGADFVKNYSARCPMGRMASDKEMGGAVLYLASEAASYTTGINIAVDGGMTAW